MLCNISLENEPWDQRLIQTLFPFTTYLNARDSTVKYNNLKEESILLTYVISHWFLWWIKHRVIRTSTFHVK